jgi:hypothetical protein
MKKRIEFWPPSWMIQGNQRGHNGSLPPSAKTAAERDNKLVRREYHGATHSITTGMHGDRTPHGVPPGYEHPQSLTGLIIEGAPRALPVSQAIQRGPERSRGEAFTQGAAEEFLVLHCLHGGFRDRRGETRPRVKGWQSEVRTTPDGIIAL